jgi:large subunit ribosomal protein L29
VRRYEARELKELTVEELKKKAKEYKEEMFNLRFQHSTGQLENTARMRLVKKDIARIETIVNEKERERPLDINKQSNEISDERLRVL